MEVKTILQILRILSSSFVLNGVNAIVGLVKMGVVSHSIEPRLIPNYFTCLAVWGWFAVNGESVRQSMRQQNLDFSARVGLNSIKYEWKLLFPFTVIILIIFEYTNITHVQLRLQDILITIFSGWLFVFTSTCTGILESKGKLELSNWISLGVSILSLPFFVYTSSRASFSVLLVVYFCLNLLSGLLHWVILSINTKPRSISQKELFKNLESTQYKKIVLLESVPRVVAPLLIAFLSTATELTLYSVLIRIFLIYGIYAISITPIVSLKGKKYSQPSLDKVLGILGPLSFVFATLFVVFYSSEIILLVGSTRINLSLFDLIAFALLGAVSIYTQPFIASISSGPGLRIRSRASFSAVLAGVFYFPILVILFGSSGAFYSLSINQILYFLLLKRNFKNENSCKSD